MTNANLLGPMIVDLTGFNLTADDKRRLAHPNTGGVILFGRNFKTRAQVTKLIKAIRAIRPNIIISVDHEGGRVQRFKSDGFTHLPSMRELGAVYAHDALHGAHLATEVGFVLASELRAVGVDYSYTPVLDLDYGGSTVIGDRAFAPSAQDVVVLAKALLHGMLQAGMAGCGKHFPGHGLWWQHGDWRSCVCIICTGRGGVGKGFVARYVASRYGRLWQAFSWAWFCRGGLARGHAC